MNVEFEADYVERKQRETKGNKRLNTNGCIPERRSKETEESDLEKSGTTNSEHRPKRWWHEGGANRTNI